MPKASIKAVEMMIEEHCEWIDYYWCQLRKNDTNNNTNDGDNPMLRNNESLSGTEKDQIKNRIAELNAEKRKMKLALEKAKIDTVINY